MNDPLHRAVYDCNIYAQALINIHGPAGGCVRLALNRSVSLFLSDTVLKEIRRIPEKPTPAKLGVTTERVETLIASILKVAVVVTNVPTRFAYPRDPDDAHYVNLALAADAKLIVSRDKDLLDLTNLSDERSKDFKLRFPMLRILDPVQFLRELKDRT